MITRALRDKIADDVNITKRLAVFDFGDGTERPAIFTDGAATVDAAAPLITIQQTGGQPYGTRDRRGSIWRFDVEVWGDKNGSRRALRGIALDLYRLLDRAELTPEEHYDVISVISDSPEEERDADGYPGYRLRLSITAIENADY